MIEHTQGPVGNSGLDVSGRRKGFRIRSRLLPKRPKSSESNIFDKTNRPVANPPPIKGKQFIVFCKILAPSPHIDAMITDNNSGEHAATTPTTRRTHVSCRLFAVLSSVNDTTFSPSRTS